MLLMPKPHPPYVRYYVTQHGKPVWYVHRNGKRTRIRETYGTPEFTAAYWAIINGTAPAPKPRSSSGTLSWLIDRYCDTTAWLSLSKATRRQRTNILRHVTATGGDVVAAAITGGDIAAGRDRRAATPHQARHFLDTMRGLFRWAHGAGHVKADPTVGVTNMSRPRVEGFKPWTEEDVVAYEARWPIGTRQRVWMDVLLYTGLRRGDACRIGKQHVRRGTATLVTKKTNTEVNLPILPVLQRTLDAGPTGDLAFIVGAKGRPFTKESFGNLFSEAARAAGVRKSCHGLRKIAATRCAENGASVPEMNAIFGWTGSKMALHYIEAANRKKMAANAMQKLAMRDE